MIDLHYHEHKVALCHELNGQKIKGEKCSLTPTFKGLSSPTLFEHWLQELKTVMSRNNQSIFILHLECYVSVADVNTLLDTAGLSQHLLNSTTPSDPTLKLGDLRKDGTRLVVFSDYAHSRVERHGIGIFPTTFYLETLYQVDKTEDNENLCATYRL